MTDLETWQRYLSGSPNYHVNIGQFWILAADQVCEAILIVYLSAANPKNGAHFYDYLCSNDKTAPHSRPEILYYWQ